jgi:hypothetical protein
VEEILFRHSDRNGFAGPVVVIAIPRALGCGPPKLRAFY